MGKEIGVSNIIHNYGQGNRTARVYRKIEMENYYPESIDFLISDKCRFSVFRKKKYYARNFHFCATRINQGTSVCDNNQLGNGGQAEFATLMLRASGAC